MRSLLFIVILILLVGALEASYQCLNESSLVFAPSGVISITQSLIQCLSNINDPLIFPGYFYGPNKPMILYNQVALNNLIRVNEVENSVTLDFYFRLFWQDPRLNMTALWEEVLAIYPSVAINGINLYEVLGVEDIVTGQTPSIWTPDILFPDSIEQEVNNGFLRILPNCWVQQSQHIIITLAQSSFKYYDYPLDEQMVMLRFFSYSLNASFLQQEFRFPSTPITFWNDYKGDASFKLNPVWSYDSNNGYIGVEDNGASLGRVRSVSYDQIYISRQPTGIILRLALPILLLAILGALAFWMPLETRTDTTITLLLAVSALYIVIFQSVPMLGYLTVFDSFVLAMFGILFGAAIVHSWLFRIAKKREVNSARDFTIRLVDAMCRCSIIPVIVAVYFQLFAPVYNAYSVGMATAACIVFSLVIGYREFRSLRKAYVNTAEGVESKVDEDESVTVIEKLLYNLFHNWKLSVDIAELKEVRASMKERSSTFGFEMKNLPKQDQPKILIYNDDGEVVGTKRSTVPVLGANGALKTASDGTDLKCDYAASARHSLRFNSDVGNPMQATAAATASAVAAASSSQPVGAQQSNKDRSSSFRLSTYNYPDSDDEDKHA